MLFIKSVTNIMKKFLLVNNITLYLTLYQGIEIINFSNLPNNSFTSIFAVFPSHRGVVTLQAQRCLRGLDGRPRSSLAVLRKIFPAPFGCEVFILKNLVRPNLYTEKPLKRNDRRDRKTHQKKCRINERQIRIRNSLPPLSNPHQIKKRRSKMKATLKIAFWLALAMFVSSMFGGSIWAWSIGLWLCKEIIAGVIRFLFGCIVFLLSAVALFGFLFWLLTL